MPTYPGGKNGAGVYQAIINWMPPHRVYIEPFLGGGAIMRLKRPAELNIGIDLVGAALHRVADDYAGPGCIVINGERRRPPPPKVARGPGPPDVDHRQKWRGDPEFRFSCEDGIEYLNSYVFDGTELVYCDPPYMHETRRSRDLYQFEMTDREHRRLLKTILRLPCPVMISGYWTELYAFTLAGWNSFTFQTVNRAGKPTTEWVWSNFPEPVELHDYRYLGSNFRERERIKRKKLRWVRRLERMPLLEKRALLVAIDQARAPSTIVDSQI